MTYQNEVLADAPYIYLTHPSGAINTNAGSATGLTITNGAGATAVAVSGTYTGTAGVQYNATNAYQQVANASANLLDGRQPFTVEAWIKRNTTTGLGVIVARAPASGTMLWYVNGTALTAQMNPSSTNVNLTAAGVITSTTAWYHVVWTNDGTNARLYVNGAQVATVASVAGPTQTTARPILIGHDSTANGANYLHGDMDEFAMYTTALSPARIAAHYTAGTTAGGAVSNIAPAMVVSVATATAPVVKAGKSIRAITTPMTVTVNTANPVSYAYNEIVADWSQFAGGTGTGGSRTTSRLDNSNYSTFFRYSYPDLTGKAITSAKLLLTRATAQTAAINYETRVATDSTVWDDSTPAPGPFNVSGIIESGSITDLGGIGTTFLVDVTQAVLNEVGNGIMIAGTTGSTVDFYLKEHTVASQRPRLLLTYEEVAGVPVTVTAPVTSLTIGVPQHRVGTATKITVTGTGSVTVNAVNPTVTKTRNIKVISPAVTLTQTFPGGRSVTPDVHAKTGVMGDYYISTPDAKQYIAVPSINTVPVITIGLIEGTSDNKVSLQTDRIVRATPMSVTLRLVGVYNREADRYVTLVGGTVDVDDTWLPLDDVSGNTARDIADYPANLTLDRNATNPPITYKGGPQLNVEGPHLRKAVRFDGVDDYIYLQYPAPITRTLNKISFEFSIRTTQLNGTILTGGGIRVATQSTDLTGLSNFNVDTQQQIRLVDGKIALYGGLANYTTGGFVADGEWHHVVISIPYLTNRGELSPYVGDTQPTYVMVDGKLKWARYGPVINAFLPSAAMAAVNYDTNGTPTVTRAVAGELSHLIIRTSPDLGQSMSIDLATKLYYEWSDTILVRPEPMTVNLGMADPHKARGNRKKMIVLFGLSNGEWPTAAGGQGFWEENNYFSIFANYYVGFEDMPEGYVRTGTNGSVQNRYSAVAPFVLDEYICYPVVLYSQQSINGAIQLSAEGMEKDGIRDPITRELIDNETGMLRFINLQEDLREPIENFDAITAINYPAEEPDFDGNTGLAINGGNRTGVYYEPKQWTKLSTAQWKVGRDKLRDSILEASYDGVNLWITEPQMAQHLEFIQAWDKHATGGDISRNLPISTAVINDPNVAYSNVRGEVVDRAHMMPGMEGNAGRAGREYGRFFFTWQANAKRVITSLEPGLTDLPGADIVDQIDYQATDRWTPHNRVTAYEVSRRPDGLHIGDSLVMPMDIDPATNFQGWSVGVPRRFIVSARPEGVAGKVISKEMDVYYGPYGVTVSNPFAGNVYTIAAERGTVVRGRPIKGRAFIEFMGADTQWKEIAVDRDRGKWHGEPGKNVSNWDFDTRRYTELIASQLVNSTTRSITVGQGGLTTIKESSGSTLVQWYEREDRDFIVMPHTSMNSRGLHWLSLTDSIPAGTARAFAGAMNVTIAAPAPKVTRTGGAVNTVVGPMRVDIDLRQPKNYRGADFRDKVLPMTIGITMVGTGKVVKTGPIELSITMPGAARVEGTGDRIFVYMDSGTEVTLFMKED